MIVGFITMVFFIVYRLPAAEMKTVIESVNTILTNPNFKHPVTAIYTLDDIAQAHQRVEGGANAKVLIAL
jgi:NADPH2:quinone reductase